MNIPAFLSALGFSTPALQSAAVTGLFILIGIVLVGVIAILAFLAVRRGEREAKRDMLELTRVGLLHALRADARTHWRLIGQLSPSEAARETIVEQIEKGRWVQPPYTPFFLRDARTDIAGAVAENVPALDVRLGDTAARYLALRDFLSQVIDDLRSERFAALPAEQKIDIVRDYFTRIGQFRAAAAALNARIEQILKIRKRDRDTEMEAAA